MNDPVYVPVNSNPTRISAQGMWLNLSGQIFVTKGWDQ